MSAERRASSSEPIRLLLIDDNVEDRHLLCDLLDEVVDMKFAIDWVRDLSSGCDLLEHGHFDICLIDHELPDGDGLSLIETASLKAVQTPVIVLGSHGSVELDRRAMAQGASGFLDKNRLDPTLLERTIRYAIRQYEIVHDLSKAALRDDATGLITPVLFQDRLARALAVAKRHQTVVALVLVDLGHDLASAELQEQHLIVQAKRLTEQLRATDTVARLADHQLALILEDLRCADDAALVSRKVLDKLAAPTSEMEGNAQRSCPFAGIALYPEDCGDVSSMHRQAEAAMRRAKADKRSTYRFGCKHVDQHVRRQFLLGDDLREA
ncbi:MAG: response regulator, partial [Geminicoccaceae bacterium]